MPDNDGTIRRFGRHLQLDGVLGSHKTLTVIACRQRRSLRPRWAIGLNLSTHGRSTARVIAGQDRGVARFGLSPSRRKSGARPDHGRMALLLDCPPEAERIVDVVEWLFCVARAYHEDRAVAENSPQNPLDDVDRFHFGEVHFDRAPRYPSNFHDHALVGDGELAWRWMSH
jgi:hypothetical protein